MDYLLSDHAKEAITERDIDLGLVEQVLGEPQQRFEVDDGRYCYQSRLERDGKEFLLRLVVEERASPKIVVTLYWTRRIKRYWRTE